MIDVLISNLLSMTALVISIGLIIRNRNIIPHARWIKTPLILAFAAYASINLSNLLEHSGITSFFDPIEDIMEIVFLLLFIFFVFGSKAYNYIQDVMNRERWLKSALNSLHEGLIATDEEGTILHTNAKIEIMIGLGRDELLGRNAGDVLRFCRKETKEEFSCNPFGGGCDCGTDSSDPAGIYLKGRNDELTLVIFHVSRVLDEKGGVLGMIGSFNDVGPYYSMMEQLNHLQRMDAIGQLTSGVAHDLNNMLGGITGAADLIKSQAKEVKPRQLNELVEIIFDSVENAKELTTNLLSFSRKNRIISTSVDLIGILKKATAIGRRTIDKIITISMDTSDEKIMITGDPAQLQNAFLNLLLNARDAQPEGGEIEIRAEKTFLDELFCTSSRYSLTAGEFVKVSICDRGSGIDQEIIDKIFEPFFTTKEAGKGTGLGLAAVDNTVSSHKGAMEIMNRKEGGCCFHLYFPLLATDNSRIEPDELNPENALKGKHILIVDDEAIIRTTTKLMLEEEALICSIAESGRKGLEMIKSEPENFDAVLLDIVMPDKGGKDTAREIYEINPDLPVFWISGFHQKEALPPHIRGFIKKPFRKAEILDALTGIL